MECAKEGCNAQAVAGRNYCQNHLREQPSAPIITALGTPYKLTSKKESKKHTTENNG